MTLVTLLLLVIACLFIAKTPRELPKERLYLIVPDDGMPRGQALARIGEALRKSAERLRMRGG